MDATIVIAVIAGAGTTLLAATMAFISLVWKIGRWQAQSEERGKAMKKRLDEFIDRTELEVARAHERMDRHLEGH